MNNGGHLSLPTPEYVLSRALCPRAQSSKFFLGAFPLYSKLPHLLIFSAIFFAEAVHPHRLLEKPLIQDRPSTTNPKGKTRFPA